MASLVTVRRNSINWSINQNPVTITIKRTEKIETEGHFIETISQVGPLTVRIYQAGKRSRSKTESSLIGTRDINTGWGLLANWMANLRAGPNVRDEFEVSDLGLFIINEVYPQKIQGLIVGYQANIERVS